MSRAITACAAALFVLCCVRTAAATEKQWFLEGTVGYGYIDEKYRWYDGAAGLLQARYGLTDALDLDFELTTTLYPKASQLVPGTHAGLLYVVDISRWVPTIGVLAGIDDVWTLSCPATKLDNGAAGPPLRPCGHDLHPSLVIPGGFEFEVTKHFALGAQFRYAFMFAGDVSKQITIGASAAFYTGN